LGEKKLGQRSVAICGGVPLYVEERGYMPYELGYIAEGLGYILEECSYMPKEHGYMWRTTVI
jgi:hypothetical protein